MKKQPSVDFKSASRVARGRLRLVLAALGICLLLVCQLVSASAATAASQKGWGAESSYLGRYHMQALSLTEATPSSGETGQAAVFDAVARACQQLGGTAPLPSGGELTMFMREVKKGKPLVPSGILDVRTASGDELLYLTYLSSNGSARQAKINGGAFVGPVIGSFSGRSAGAGTILATATVEGLGSLKASYSRFSASPQP